MPDKRPPPPRRFNAALIDKAYARSRARDGDDGLGKTYVFSQALETRDDIAAADRLDAVRTRCIAECGVPAQAPAPAGAADRKDRS